jgi:putative hemolysin
MNTIEQLEPPKSLCRLDPRSPAPGLDRLSRLAGRTLESVLAVDRLNSLYGHCARGAPSTREFLHRCLDWIHVRWKPTASELSRIPRTGPLVVVANHPFGALEGIVLSAILSEVRPDVKVMANFLLERITELRDLFIFVDPFENETSAASNVSGLRQSVRHLREGGVLAVFPAGEVASVDLRRRQIVDPAWNTTVARIIQKTGAPVLPVFFEGRNSILFQALGLVHPRLRTAMLAREFFARRRTRIDARIGSVIPARRISAFENPQELTDYLRHRTYLLQHRTTERSRCRGLFSARLTSTAPRLPLRSIRDFSTRKSLRFLRIRCCLRQTIRSSATRRPTRSRGPSANWDVFAKSPSAPPAKGPARRWTWTNSIVTTFT